MWRGRVPDRGSAQHLGKTRYQRAEGDTWGLAGHPRDAPFPGEEGQDKLCVQDLITAIWAGETGAQGSWCLLSTVCIHSASRHTTGSPSL